MPACSGRYAADTIISLCCQPFLLKIDSSVLVKPNLTLSETDGYQEFFFANASRTLHCQPVESRTVSAIKNCKPASNTRFWKVGKDRSSERPPERYFISNKVPAKPKCGVKTDGNEVILFADPSKPIAYKRKRADFFGQIKYTDIGTGCPIVAESTVGSQTDIQPVGNIF